MTDADHKAKTLQKLATMRRRIAELEREAGIDPQAKLGDTEDPDHQSLRAFELVADYATDMISIHADNGDFLFVSANCEEFFGWTQAQLLGRNSYEFFHPTDVKRIASDHADHDVGHEGRVRYRMRKRDGSYLWVETRSRARLTDEGVKEIVALTTNIEPNMQAEYLRNRATEAHLEAARQASFARLAQAMAHEINNPLTIAMVAADTLTDHAQGPSLRKALKRIKGVVDELNLLVEQGGSRIQPLFLRDVLQRLVKLQADAPEDVRVKSTSCRVRTEVGRLHQLLYIVLSIHFRGHERAHHHPVTIRCSPSDTPGFDVCIAIQGGPESADLRVRSDFLFALRGDADHGGSSLELIERLATELQGQATIESTDEGLLTTIDLPNLVDD